MTTFLLKSCNFFQNFPENVISKQLYIVKLSSYIKEQLKFASFLGVEWGGGPKQPLKSENLGGQK